MNKKELKNYMKSLVLRFGEKIQCEWLDMDGCKWIATKMEIDTYFLSEFEKGHIRNLQMKKLGVECILFERERQVEVEGWTYKHDDKYVCGELSDAAVCYATRGYWRNSQRNPIHFMIWPFSEEWWKPTPEDRIKELSKAGALIAAEIDRLQRLNNEKIERS